MKTNTSNISALKLKSHIVLVGLMGCGKSAIGKRLANAIGADFIDSDTVITQQEGISISQIFEEKGEAYFRKLERDILHKLLEDSTPKIIATGGGAFINDETRQMMLNESLVIWIKAEFDVLLERVSRKKTRPLLEKGNKADILKELMHKRYPIYAKAPLMIESENVAHEVTLAKTIETIRNFYDLTR